MVVRNAGVAELADALDSKSLSIPGSNSAIATCQHRGDSSNAHTKFSRNRWAIPTPARARTCCWCWDGTSISIAGCARMGVLRAVENGFALARSARNGLLTLSDNRGRIMTRVSTPKMHCRRPYAFCVPRQLCTWQAVDAAMSAPSPDPAPASGLTKPEAYSTNQV